MDPSDLSKLIDLFAKKEQLTGFEYMLYTRLCELMETWCRRTNKNLLEGLDKDEPGDASS